MPNRSPNRLAALRRRFRLLQVGLFLPVVITALLAAAYLDAVRTRERVVDVAGRQLARRVADRVLAAAGRRGDSAAANVLGPVQRMRVPTSEAAFGAMASVTDSLRACRCGPLKEGAFFFYWVPSTGDFAASARIPDGQDPRPRLSRDEAFASAPLGEIRAAGGTSDSVPWLLHYTTRSLPNGRVAVIGLDISMTSWWNDTFGPAIAATRHQFFAAVSDPDTAFVAFLLAGQRVLAGEKYRFDGPHAAVSTSIGGGYQLGISVNPAIVLLIASSAPPSYQLLIGALVASTLMSAIALVLLNQIRRTMAQQEAFAASISHELRTPLTEVLLHAESLQFDAETPETKARAADSIVRETRRLISLVENALTMAGAGRDLSLPERPSPVNAASVVRGVLPSFGPAAAERKARIEVALDETLSCAIDPVSLDRIVTNLVHNALRYGPLGQTILIAIRKCSEGTELLVSDQGPGVPVSEQESIWDPFKRGSTRGRAEEGVGLGLAIVRHLAERVGGSTCVHSEPGVGASFIVRLPSI